MALLNDPCEAARASFLARASQDAQMRIPEWPELYRTGSGGRTTDSPSG
jgi:hypothetical protein